MPKDLCYLEGKYREMYLHDMKICQAYASMNRHEIARIILDKYGMNTHFINTKWFETIHNYINFTDNIVRKGAISAYEGERVIIPINMRDGSIIAVGKVKLDEFKKSMEGIYTTSVVEETIDEAPFVYKPMQEIIDNIKDTVEIQKIIKPIYNFKAKD